MTRPPVVGRTEVVSRVSGTVAIRLRRATAFVRLTGSRTVPDGSEIDATAGRVTVSVATGKGRTISVADAYGGRFVVHQVIGAPVTTHFTLSARLSCTAVNQRKLTAGTGLFTRSAPRRRSPRRTASLPTSGRLFVSEHGGHFEADARYVSAIGIGTAWQTADNCFSSIVRVTDGIVRARNLLTGATALLRAGESYNVRRPERAGYLPSPGVYFGVTGQPVDRFTSQVGRRQAVYGAFTHWGQSLRRDLVEAQAAHARLLLHISTATGYNQPELITPGQIAQGAGDDYLLALNSQIAQSGHPVYIAFLPEMNQTNNAYSAVNPDGSSRGADHSPAAYRQAWRRTVLIVRGGPVAAINQQLSRLGLPPLQTPPSPPPTQPPSRRSAAEAGRQRDLRQGVGSLSTPKIAFLWAPQVAGSPDIPSNSAASYYPGSAFVDIVGTDFYSRFPNFGGLARFYAQYPTKPFGFNEWGMWENGATSFVRRFFAFVRSHPRVQLVVYNQGLLPTGPFRLTRFPAAKREIRRQLRLSAAVDYTPDWVPVP